MLRKKDPSAPDAKETNLDDIFASLGYCPRRACPALRSAVRRDDLEAAKAAVEAGASLVCTNCGSEPLLFDAVRQGAVDILCWAFAAGHADSATLDKDGTSLAQLALRYGRGPLALWLVADHGVDPNVVNKYGLTLLSAAASTLDLPAIKILIDDHGADPGVGMSVLECAINAGRLGVAKYIATESDAGRREIAESGRSVLVPSSLVYAALEKGHLDIAEWLVDECGVSSYVIPWHARVFLDGAAAGVRADMAAFLAKHGALVPGGAE